MEPYEEGMDSRLGSGCMVHGDDHIRECTTCRAAF